MIVDGNTLKSGTVSEASVGIVGSGPAGLALAVELLEAGADVTLVESGGAGIVPSAQALNDGRVVGDDYAGLSRTRHRQLGGTTHAWNTPVRGEIGAKFAPLEPADFDVRPQAGDFAAWPIDYSALEAFYPRAQQICGLGPFDYSARPMIAAGHQPFELAGGHLVSKIYQFGLASRFFDTHLATLRRADRAQVVTNATVCDFEVKPGGSLAALSAVNGRGGTVQIRARAFVLACGAIENARLLLQARQETPRFIEDPHDWLGRCFMEHPRDTALALLPGSNETFERARFYDAHDIGQDQTIGGRLAFAGGPPQHSGLPNMSVTLLPRRRPPGSLLQRLTRGRRQGPSGGYGWSAEKDLPRWFDGFRMLVNLEQRPQVDNRVVLSEQRDAHGRPRAELHWRWSVAEQESLARLRAVIVAEVEASRLGRVEVQHDRRPDPNAHHHAGTTRMADTPIHGVVDTDCRVFGSENLYVTGASVLPTAGFANPTLTIVALAARLAAHLRRRL